MFFGQALEAEAGSRMSSAAWNGSGDESCVVDYAGLETKAASLTAISTLCSAILLLVILGNGLVVASILSHRSLHTTTNFIITSLAVSDLLLGLSVLPFSIWKEVTSLWGFGEVWCNIWLALDVWLSTASIYNVVAISFDRFMAVTRPLKYRLVSSTKVGRVLVSLAWVVSFAISLPPIIIWTAFTSDGAPPDPLRNRTPHDGPEVCDCSPTDNSDTYIYYSAVGSFLLPLFLIIAFNAGIYRAVLNASTLSLPSPGSKWRKTKQRLSANNVTLRAHRGGMSNHSPNHSVNSDTKLNGSAGPTPKRSKASATATQSPSRTLLRLQLPSSSVNGARKAASFRVSKASAAVHRVRFSVRRSRSPAKAETILRELPSPLWEGAGGGDAEEVPSSASHPAGSDEDAERRELLKPEGSPRASATLLPPPSTPLLNGRKLSNDAMRLTKVAQKMKEAKQLSSSHQRAEQRVAKTVSVVVGAYLVCWMPFAFVYLLQAKDICKVDTCLPSWLFTIIFWLGYANSAINPIIYALFSRDFRRAFKRVLQWLIPRRIRKLVLKRGSGRSDSFSMGRNFHHSTTAGGNHLSEAFPHTVA